MAAPSLDAVETNAAARYATGLTLVGFGGIVLSGDIPLIRLSESGFYTVVLVRGALSSLAAVFLWWLARRLGRASGPLIAGRLGLFVTGLYAVATLTFLVAVYETKAANVVFILALNPIFAALLSWAIAGEKPSRATLLAIPATLFGVLLIIGAGLEAGHWIGDLAALATAFLIALALTLARRSRQDMRYASALAAIVPALIALPFVVTGGGIESEAVGWLVVNGAILMPLALICLAAGPMFVPSPVVSMGYLLETVLAPIWMWLIFLERPSNLSLLGGGVIIATLGIHAFVELKPKHRILGAGPKMTKR
ncbi:DMT family transporter [Jiella mangrovi]|uniref:DMT family transporter n=1 Tax=Jiella mangrovi TaxID=2821407 RepID=A0ABS4BKU7_9HYPH|nr:DMT family transporter [Jiella mangrovi]MBP0617336.1 DMT family transporter [Jiella mangrovi]